MSQAGLRRLWDNARSSFWFIPALMAAGALVLAAATLAGDAAWRLDRQPGAQQWLVQDAATARQALAAVLGAAATIVSITFSLTLLVLLQAATQFGPQLLYNFMRDRGNQMVLGTFVATMVYAAAVLYAVRSAPEPSFVPSVSVLLVFACFLVSVGVLVYFIHHVSEQVQSPQLAARLAGELGRKIIGALPEAAAAQADAPAGASGLPERFAHDSVTFVSHRGGYLQTVRYDRLLSMCEREGMVAHVLVQPGDFVLHDQPILRASPGDRVGRSVVREVSGAFTLGVRRSVVQDLEFAIKQLVQVGVRAVSPTLNDPFTAINVLNQIGGALATITRRSLPPTMRYGRDGQLRLVVQTISYGQLLDHAFSQLRLYGRSYPEVILRMFEILGSLAHYAHVPEQRRALRAQADRLIESVTGDKQPTTWHEYERCEVRRAYDAAIAALDTAAWSGQTRREAER